MHLSRNAGCLGWTAPGHRFLCCLFNDVSPIFRCSLSCCLVLATAFAFCVARDGCWLAALLAVYPLQLFIADGSVKLTRMFDDIAILRLITDLDVLHESMLIMLFPAPHLYETAPSNGGHNINQRSLMLGQLCSDYRTHARTSTHTHTQKTRSKRHTCENVTKRRASVMLIQPSVSIF